jgi:hypothetical protein
VSGRWHDSSGYREVDTSRCPPAASRSRQPLGLGFWVALFVALDTFVALVLAVAMGWLP